MNLFTTTIYLIKLSNYAVESYLNERNNYLRLINNILSRYDQRQMKTCLDKFQNRLHITRVS